MAKTKSKTAEIISNQMMWTTPEQVSQVALALMDRIQGEKASNQILGIASALICMLELYELDHSDVLGQAHNYVYSGDFGNMKPEFKAIKRFMKEEWNL